MLERRRNRRSAGFRPGLRSALQGGRAPRSAALHRRTGGLLRLRHRALHRDSIWPTPHKPDVLGTPDILLMLTEELAVVDNLSGKLYLDRVCRSRAARRLRSRHSSGWTNCAAQLAPAGENSRHAPSYAASAGRIGIWRRRLQGRRWKKPSATSSTATSCRWCCRSAWRSLSPPRRCRCIARCAALNPSPYMFYYDMGDHHVVGASPEILVRLEERHRHRAPDRRHPPARQDAAKRTQALAEDLLADPKELAEHLMLMDLGRNDVGRVAADRHGEGHREHGDRALLARDAHRLQRRRQAESRA